MDIESTLADFSIDESFNYGALLDEAIETIIAANTELSAEAQQADAELEALVDPLRKLKESQAFFAPTLTVQPVNREDFAARGLEPSHGVEKWMDEYDFYRVQVPVTLSPATGWAFTRLECWVGFEVEGADSVIKVHDIHPHNAWTEILNLKTHLRLGLNEELNFRASVEQSIYDALSIEAKTMVEVDGGAHLVVGPFEYDVRRPKVHAVGRENDQVFWRLDSQEHVAYDEPHLAAVLRVPKDTEVVNAQGMLIAYNRFDFLSSHLKDWSGKFREKVVSFLGKGVPLKAEASWPGAIVRA